MANAIVLSDVSSSLLRILSTMFYRLLIVLGFQSALSGRSPLIVAAFVKGPVIFVFLFDTTKRLSLDLPLQNDSKNSKIKLVTQRYISFLVLYSLSLVSFLGLVV